MQNKAATPALDSNKTAAFFDFDGTLIAGYSAYYLLKEQVKRKLLGRNQITEVILGMVNYRAKLINADELMTIGTSHLKGVLGIFRPKTTRIAESPAIRGLPGGITFPEPVNIPRLCASVPPDPVVFHSFRRYRYPSS